MNYEYPKYGLWIGYELAILLMMMNFQPRSPLWNTVCSQSMKLVVREWIFMLEVVKEWKTKGVTKCLPILIILHFTRHIYWWLWTTSERIITTDGVCKSDNCTVPERRYRSPKSPYPMSIDYLVYINILLNDCLSFMWTRRLVKFRTFALFQMLYINLW